MVQMRILLQMYFTEREPIPATVILSLCYLLCFVAHEETFVYPAGPYTALYRTVSFLIVFLLTDELKYQKCYAVYHALSSVCRV